MDENSSLFWTFWGTTVGLCAWKILEGFWRPDRMLEWPFLACAIWVYFYGYMAYDVMVSLSDYLSGEMLWFGALLPLFSLVGLLCGWKLGMRVTTHTKTPQHDYSLPQIWGMGIVLLLIGMVGANFFLTSGGEGIDLETTSAYAYLSFYCGYPGLVLAVWAASKMSGPNRMLLWMITAVGVVVFILPFLAGSRRGPLFPAMMALLVVPALANRRAPNPVAFGIGLAVVGVTMLLCLQIREFRKSADDSWVDVVRQMSLTKALRDRGQEAADNEYLNNCALIAAVRQSGKYQYGSGHVGMLLHWIPRAWWPDKPALGEGLYSHQEMFDAVESIAGVRLIGGGAAAGGVADSFTQYGYFTPLFWFGISWFMARVYVRARWGSDPRWLWSYAGLVCVTHWLISQAAANAFVPAMVFVLIPLAVSVVLPRIPQRTVPGSPAAGPSRTRSEQPVV